MQQRTRHFAHMLFHNRIAEGHAQVDFGRGQEFAVTSGLGGLQGRVKVFCRLLELALRA